MTSRILLITAILMAGVSCKSLKKNKVKANAFTETLCMTIAQLNKQVYTLDSVTGSLRKKNFIYPSHYNTNVDTAGFLNAHIESYKDKPTSKETFVGLLAQSGDMGKIVNSYLLVKETLGKCTGIQDKVDMDEFALDYPQIRYTLKNGFNVKVEVSHSTLLNAFLLHIYVETNKE